MKFGNEPESKLLRLAQHFSTSHFAMRRGSASRARRQKWVEAAGARSAWVRTERWRRALSARRPGRT